MDWPWKQIAKFEWNEARGWRTYAEDLEKQNSMEHSESEADTKMSGKYDFTGGVRGKYANRYTITMEDIDQLRNTANFVLDISRLNTNSQTREVAKRLYDLYYDVIGDALRMYRKEHGY